MDEGAVSMEALTRTCQQGGQHRQGNGKGVVSWTCGTRQWGCDRCDGEGVTDMTVRARGVRWWRCMGCDGGGCQGSSPSLSGRPHLRLAILIFVQLSCYALCRGYPSPGFGSGRTRSLDGRGFSERVTVLTHLLHLGFQSRAEGSLQGATARRAER